MVTPLQSHYLRLVRQEGDKYAMHKASADRAGNNDYLKSIADGQWRVLQMTIADALTKFDQPAGVAQNNGISTGPVG